jgi:hypothetical protein
VGLAGRRTLATVWFGIKIALSVALAGLGLVLLWLAVVEPQPLLPIVAASYCLLFLMTLWGKALAAKKRTTPFIVIFFGTISLSLTWLAIEVADGQITFPSRCVPTQGALFCHLFNQVHAMTGTSGVIITLILLNAAFVGFGIVLWRNITLGYGAVLLRNKTQKKRRARRAQ